MKNQVSGMTAMAAALLLAISAFALTSCATSQATQGARAAQQAVGGQQAGAEQQTASPSMPASNQYKDRAKSLVTGKPSAAPSASSAPAQASLPTATVPTASDGTQSATASSGAAAQPAVSSLRSAAEDRAYDAFMKDLPNYLSRLTFMVYFNEKSSPDPQIAKMSVGSRRRRALSRLRRKSPKTLRETR